MPGMLHVINFLVILAIVDGKYNLLYNKVIQYMLCNMFSNSAKKYCYIPVLLRRVDETL